MNQLSLEIANIKRQNHSLITKQHDKQTVRWQTEEEQYCNEPKASNQIIHPKLTWSLEIGVWTVWTIIFVSKRMIFTFHVGFWEEYSIFHSFSFCRATETFSLPFERCKQLICQGRLRTSRSILERAFKYRMLLWS